VREFAVGAVESCSLQRLLDHPLQLPWDKTLQATKALEPQYVTQPFNFPAAAGGGFGVTAHEA
jgi:hypothetical protein